LARCAAITVAGGCFIFSALFSPAQATLETINFSGTVSHIVGTGSGITNGSTVSGTVAFDPSKDVPIFGDGVSSYVTNASATATVDINGTVSTFQGIEEGVSLEGTDASGQGILSDRLSISWGADYVNGLSIDVPAGTFGAPYASEVSTADPRWWADRLPYPMDASIAVGFEYLPVNGAVAPLLIYGPPPLVSIWQSNQYVIVSYPTNAAGYRLQSSPLLPAWQPVANPAVLNGTNWLVTLPANSGALFFRLGITN